MREYLVENITPMVWLLIAATIHIVGHKLQIPGIDLLTGAALTRVRKGAPPPILRGKKDGG